MKLYYLPGSCSLAPHIALEESGIEHNIDKVTHGEPLTESGAELRKVNPKGYVPALDLGDGEILTEVSVVLQYIADQAPESGLMPAAGTRDRYRAQEWLNYTATELHKNFAPLFTPDTPDATLEAAKQNLKNRFGLVNDRLSEHEFVFEDRFTVVDAYIFTVATWHNFVQLPMDAYPNVASYVERLSQRPSVMAAMKAEGLLG